MVSGTNECCDKMSSLFDVRPQAFKGQNHSLAEKRSLTIETQLICDIMNVHDTSKICRSVADFDTLHYVKLYGTQTTRMLQQVNKLRVT